MRGHGAARFGASDEAELIRICQNPEDDRFESAFEELFVRYRDRVYSIAYRMTGKATDAMDVVQESFCILFRRLSSFRADSQFTTWLFRIVVNCSIDHQRRELGRRRPSAGGLPIDGLDPEDPGDGPVDSAESAELGRHVQAAIARLSPKLRAIMILRYLEGQSYEQLAETLELSLGTVKSRLARGHLALEGLLGDTLERFGYTPAQKEGPDGTQDGGWDDQGVA